MTLQRTGEMSEFIIDQHLTLMDYLETEGSEGLELLPLLKSKLGGVLRNEVQSVRYRAPHLVAMVAATIEPIELAQRGPGAMQPMYIRSIPLDDSSLSVNRPSGLTQALISACTEPDIALELGLIWPADIENSRLVKEAYSLEIQLESAQEINTLLIHLAKTLAEEKGEQLQEQIIAKATTAMLSESAASQLVANTGNTMADLFGSPFGGILQTDIRSEVLSQIGQLDAIDRLALCLCEPDRVLEDWVENQFCAFPTPEFCYEIELSCEMLIEEMARDVEREIHAAAEAETEQ